MSVRGGATVTGSLFFDVGDCRLIDSAVFLLEDENGEFLIELDLFNPMATHRPTPIPAPVPTPTPR